MLFLWATCQPLGMEEVLERMEQRIRIGDSRLVVEDDAQALVAVVEEEIAHGEHELCIDATQLGDDDPETVAMMLRRCAMSALRARGHLTVICPFGPVRTALSQAGLPVLSDRSIAETVLS